MRVPLHLPRLAAEEDGDRDEQSRRESSCSAVAFIAESSAEEDSTTDHPRSVDYSEAATAELLFLCRMKCIENLKNTIENGRFRWNQAEEFRAKLHELIEMWNELTFADVEIASKSQGKHLGRLFKVLTLKVPQVYVDVDVPVDWGYGSGKVVAYKVARRVAKDSHLYTSLEGRMKYFRYTKHTDGDPSDLELMWRQHIDEAGAARALSYKHWQTPVDVEVVGVNLRRPHSRCRTADPDLLLMSQLAKVKPEVPYDTAAHAFVYMCWKRQRPLYLVALLCTVASILALIDITYCAKVLECPLTKIEEPCCLKPEVHRRLSPRIVFSVGAWLLLTDVIQAFILIHEMKYSLSSLFTSSTCFELFWEVTTTVVAGQMAWRGWTYAKKHYIKYFIVVSCRWLHLLYVLVPLPVVGKTVLPMYKAVTSYESIAFILVNLLMLAASFQAYISLRSDINVHSYPDGLEQPLGDALLNQYRLNFLGEFSVDELRGESLQLQGGVISTKIGDSERRQGVAFFMIFVTFTQAVLGLNLYISILGEAYQRHKEAVQSEFLQFRAHFILKNLCLVHVLDKIVWLGRLNDRLAQFSSLAEADSLWVLCGDSKKRDRSPDLLEGEIPQHHCEEGQSPHHMRKLSESLISRADSINSRNDD